MGSPPTLVFNADEDGLTENLLAPGPGDDTAGKERNGYSNMPDPQLASQAWSTAVHFIHICSFLRIISFIGNVFYD